MVDDDKMNRAVVKGLLKETLVQMDFADSGEKCLSMLAGKRYDVILLDHMMPVMDGMETLAKMRKRYPDCSAKVIALTANAISGAKQIYLDSGFDDYLTKPIEGRALEKMLMEYLPEAKIEKTMEAGENTKNDVQEKLTGQIIGIKGSKQLLRSRRENSQEEDGTFTLTELQKWKEAIPELDVLTGLQYNLEEKTFYLEMLQMFTEQDKTAELNQYYEQQDWEGYQIAVHALKSTALSIGLARLSEQTRQLEYAAKRKDENYIRLYHEEVMQFYEECLKSIRKCMEKSSKS